MEFVKRGGRLIIGVGRESDVPMLNRFLLQPLRLGRLGGLVETPGPTGQAPMPRPWPGWAAFPGIGHVQVRYASGSPSRPIRGRILLSQGGRGEAVLVSREFHRGQVLLWTTDIDDLEWTDLGIAPLTPLLHQAFQEAGSRERDRRCARGFGFRLHRRCIDPGAAGARDPPSRCAIRKGAPFTKVRVDGPRLRIGPFDKLGIHRVIAGKDTQAFAVNLPGPARAAAPASGGAGKRGTKAPRQNS